MKSLPWDRILGLLGLIFAIVPWFWLQGAGGVGNDKN